MRIGFKVDPTAKDGWDRLELQCANAFAQGTARVHHEHEVIFDKDLSDPTKYDIVAMFGVKKRDLFLKCVETGTRFFYFDKAYNRNKTWWKLSVNAHHPTKFLSQIKRSSDRRDKQGWHCKKWRPYSENGHILIAGSSGKYHKLYGLDDPTEYWTMIIKELRGMTDRKILYRPKKSYHEARPIEGSEFSKAPEIEDDLEGAHCMITHGSNSCFEALLEGIPAIVLGSGITEPISSASITETTIRDPHKCTDAAKDLILNNLAYFQWHINELSMGIMWPTLNECLGLDSSFKNGNQK